MLYWEGGEEGPGRILAGQPLEGLGVDSSDESVGTSPYCNGSSGSVLENRSSR
jgi:hypothetical protein